VVLGGTSRDDEPLSDLRARESSGDEAQDLHLPIREPAGQICAAP
jgi:hypothetical protein